MINSKPIDFWTLLSMTQEHITREYAAILTDREKLPQAPRLYEQFVRDGGYQAEGVPAEELTERLYREMAEYSMLTPFLVSPTLEEINVNSWDDIALTQTDGSIVKAAEHFHSPQHAEDIVKRLLQHSGMILDNATPIAQGHLPNNTRLTALKTPGGGRGQRYCCLHPAPAPAASEPGEAVGNRPWPQRKCWIFWPPASGTGCR